MIDLQQIKDFFAPSLRNNPNFAAAMLKEYVELVALEYLSSCKYNDRLTFIGGTNLRLTKGIDRFSEDLDFDCKDLDAGQFIEATDGVINHLRRWGWPVEPRDRDNRNLTAFRRNMYFPGLLYDLGLTGHKDKRFLLKIEAQDQGINYQCQTVNVRGCGFFFPIRVPTDSVMLSMKIAALLARGKGRDFYDVMFLADQTGPDYDFLRHRCGISDPSQLSTAFYDLLSHTDLAIKRRDFEHLIFDGAKSAKILDFAHYSKLITTTTNL